MSTSGDEEKGKPLELATKTPHQRFEEHKDNLKSSLCNLHESNQTTTEEKIKAPVNLAKLLGSMGMGIDSRVCLDTANAVLCSHAQEKDYKMVTKSVV